MPILPRPLPDDLGDAFAVSAAMDAGVSESRLRRGDLEAPFWGVRRVRASEPEEVADTPLEIARAVAARVRRDAETLAPYMPSDWFFAGRTAAVLQGATLDHGDDLDIAVFAPGRTPRRGGVHGRRVAPDLAHTHTVAGLRMTRPASTWAMLGTELTGHELIRLGDEFVRIPRGDGGRRLLDEQATTPALLAAAVTAGRRPGVVRLRTALSRIRVGSMSLLETDWRIGAEDAGLPEPELDVEIRDRSGGLLGIADGAHLRFGVLTEVEGDHHRTSAAQWDRDIGKHAAFAAAGFEVVRLTKRHVHGDDPAAPRILRAALRRGGWAG